MKKRIAILGKRSFLGHAIEKQARILNYDPVVVGSEEIVMQTQEEVQKKIESLDVSAVFNCIAFTAVDLAEKEKEKAHFLNVEFPYFLAVSSEKLKMKMIHFSTDYVFDGQKGAPYKEEDATCPVNIYGKTKLEGEKRVLEACPSAVVLRTAWLYGFGKKNYITHIIEELKKEHPFQVVEDQKSSPTFITDLAELSFHALGLKGIYHLVNKGQASRMDCAWLIKKLMEISNQVARGTIQPIRFKSLQLPANRPFETALDTTKFEQETKVKIRSWQEALTDFFHHYRGALDA